MDAFVKSFATYRTTKKAAVISSKLVVDSLEAETSTVVVKGVEIGRSDAGNWLIIDGSVYSILQVKPQGDRTTLTLQPPLSLFSRRLELFEQPVSQTVGNFVAEQMQSNWVNGPDLTYAIGYLTVTNSDTTPLVAPELDNSGCFSLADYCRLMRKSYRITVRFSDAGSSLLCTIRKAPEAARQVSFEDGRSQLQRVDYSTNGMAKLTVLCDVETGEKDENGDKILVRERSDWYLSESGEITQSIPARRASGAWSTVYVKGQDKVQQKVIETFAKNKADHKLEFISSLDLNVLDNCTFWVYGELLQSHISYKQKRSNDDRYYYKSGELATTATEKLRGLRK